MITTTTTTTTTMLLLLLLLLMMMMLMIAWTLLARLKLHIILHARVAVGQYDLKLAANGSYLMRKSLLN